MQTGYHLTNLLRKSTSEKYTQFVTCFITKYNLIHIVYSFQSQIFHIFSIIAGLQTVALYHTSNTDINKTMDIINTNQLDAHYSYNNFPLKKKTKKDKPTELKNGERRTKIPILKIKFSVISFSAFSIYLTALGNQITFCYNGSISFQQISPLQIYIYTFCMKILILAFWHSQINEIN